MIWGRRIGGQGTAARKLGVVEVSFIIGPFETALFLFLSADLCRFRYFIDDADIRSSTIITYFIPRSSLDQLPNNSLILDTLPASFRLFSHGQTLRSTLRFLRS